MVTTQEIFEAAARLPDSQRVELIDALLATLEPSPCASSDAVAAWRQVASERAGEIDRGDARAIPWEDVRQEGERRIQSALAGAGPHDRDNFALPRSLPD